MPLDDRMRVLRAYVGDRENRRHKPGRAFERATYCFDVLSDYGAFRDLQRHRMLTIDWQHLTTGTSTPCARLSSRSTPSRWHTGSASICR